MNAGIQDKDDNLQIF